MWFGRGSATPIGNTPSMLVVKMILFLPYVDWLTCHFKLFSIFVLQCDWLVLCKQPQL